MGIRQISVYIYPAGQANNIKQTKQPAAQIYASLAVCY